MSASLTLLSQKSSGQMPSPKAPHPVQRVESELLSQVYSFQGQAVVATMGGSVGKRRQAMDAFLESARSAKWSFWRIFF